MRVGAREAGLKSELKSALWLHLPHLMQRQHLAERAIFHKMPYAGSHTNADGEHRVQGVDWPSVGFCNVLR